MPETVSERRGRQMFEAAGYIGWDAWDELHPAVKARMIDDAAKLYEAWRQEWESDPVDAARNELVQAVRHAMTFGWTEDAWSRVRASERRLAAAERGEDG